MKYFTMFIANFYSLYVYLLHNSKMFSERGETQRRRPIFFPRYIVFVSLPEYNSCYCRYLQMFINESSLSPTVALKISGWLIKTGCWCSEEWWEWQIVFTSFTCGGNFYNGEFSIIYVYCVHTTHSDTTQ